MRLVGERSVRSQQREMVVHELKIKISSLVGYTPVHNEVFVSKSIFFDP